MNSDPDRQIPLLSIGFRPFFLAAGLYSILAMLAWITWLMLHGMNAVILQPTIAVPAHLWHGHEMLFGYAGAVITGFMLTAVPGWTGARRIAGTPLLILLAAWFIGRVAMWFSSFLPAYLVALADMGYLPLLAGAVAYALAKRPQARNGVFLIMILVLIFANGAVHAEWLGWSDDTASWGLAVAMLDIVVMITVLGGRVVPSFTRNAMMRRGEMDNHPKQHSAIELLSIAGVVVVLICQLLPVSETVVGATAIAAGLANLCRQALWRPGAVLGEPILWNLHLAYLWIPLGLFSMAGAIFVEFPSHSAALHVLGIGAIGGMTLAMMTRAPLGHTGRPLVVRNSVALAYVMIALAAMLRGFALDLMADGYFQIVLAAGVLWMAGFAVFAVVYLPILIGPSLKTQSTD